MILMEEYPCSEVIKLFSCSAEHEILDACKYKNIKKFSYFQAQISWHSNIYEQEKFHVQLSEWSIKILL